MFFKYSSQLKFQNAVFSCSRHSALALLECSKNIEIQKVEFIRNGVQKDYNLAECEQYLPRCSTQLATR